MNEIFVSGLILCILIAFLLTTIIGMARETGKTLRKLSESEDIIIKLKKQNEIDNTDISSDDAYNGLQSKS